MYFIYLQLIKIKLYYACYNTCVTRSGQPTVLIDGNTYYTLESAMEWEITKAEEFMVSLVAHKGEEWIKNRETMKRKPVMEKAKIG